MNRLHSWMSLSGNYSVNTVGDIMDYVIQKSLTVYKSGFNTVFVNWWECANLVSKYPKPRKRKANEVVHQTTFDSIVASVWDGLAVIGCYIPVGLKLHTHAGRQHNTDRLLTTSFKHTNLQSWKRTNFQLQSFCTSSGIKKKRTASTELWSRHILFTTKTTFQSNKSCDEDSKKAFLTPSEPVLTFKPYADIFVVMLIT